MIIIMIIIVIVITIIIVIIVILVLCFFDPLGTLHQYTKPMYCFFVIITAKCRVKTSGVMEQCTELQTYDYFSGSEISFALTFLLVGLLPFSK